MKVDDTQANSDKCSCSTCPSYPGNEPWLYCARGESPSKVILAGCMCPGCPIEGQYKLDSTFYCTEGAAE